MNTPAADDSRMRMLVRSDDLDETREMISTAYSPYELRALDRPQDFSAWYAEGGFPGITLSALGYGTETLVAPEPLTSYLLVCQVHQGRIRLESAERREEQFVSPGDTYVMDPHQRLRVYWAPGTRVTTIRLDRELAERAAGDALGREEPVRALFGLGGAVSKAAAESWAGISATIHREVMSGGVARTSPLVASQLTQTAAATLMATHRLLPGSEAVRHVGNVAHPAVRRAIQLIEERSDQPLSLSDLAVAARCSPRALQEAFQRYVGRTPLAYLREVRLDRAHRDLVAADADGPVTVAEIAFRWGFSNLGRFANWYRLRYGHAPSLTLRA
ncbi:MULTISPECIES: AraC family transcriptional regulator [unclassified Streptomyces]|uniref:helix-turn-helix transcriptional regulator n=1 Tax=unclassified Streptomyces TaxID=2593676 RepID=UPI002DDC8708|nr:MULTISPECIES: AraC family transcriptional regulator [unclassified Streptomyces]WSA91356.1 AraC family transcriptional regulator [Streptomyces sp. NBC_01795]WSB75680.1 AraC family transcriptional regulator [Streptomyces sp. NBC_01775]WSS16035.1 AraC family transcriptional regulator [Streptomyces sp. NBC_01186]WSS44855.1 AraC family transcriptional regulator [Streptomyces sp. NBC_01187]